MSNILGFLILSIINNQDATGKLNGMTIKDIADAEQLGCMDNTIYKQLKQFIDTGYVAVGFKDGHANTYYITELGKEYLRKERSET